MQKKIVNSMVLLATCVSLSNLQAMQPLDAEFYKAAGSGDIARLEERLKAGVVIDAARPDNGLTALHNAVEQGQVAVVQKLIEMNADASKENKQGITAIGLAADLYKKAVNNGDMARQVDYTKILNVLIGNIGISDQDLLRSVVLYNPLQLDRALQAGANPNVRSAGKNGIIPLQYVIKHFPENLVLKAIESLVAKGADVAAKDESGHTPLSQAIRRGDVEAVELLLKLKADPNQVGFRDYTPLLYTLSIGSDRYQEETQEIVEVLLKNGATAVTADSDGRTPLLVAAEKGNVFVAKMLLDKGADVAVKSLDNDTPLTSALEKGSLPMVRLLIERGADLTATNRSGETVAQIVARKKLTTPEWQALVGSSATEAPAEPQKTVEPTKSDEPTSLPLPPKRGIQPGKPIPQPPSELEESLQDLAEALGKLEQELTP